MSTFIEAVITLLPVDAGGRTRGVPPRDGSYRPFVRLANGHQIFRVRLIEGPPLVEVGTSASVVVEVEGSAFDAAPVVRGCELDIIEDDRVVGLILVGRIWRQASPATQKPLTE